MAFDIYIHIYFFYYRESVNSEFSVLPLPSNQQVFLFTNMGNNSQKYHLNAKFYIDSINIFAGLVVGYTKAQ